MLLLFLKEFEKIHQDEIDVNKDEISGLIWYVAISGFAILNIPSYANSIKGGALTGFEIMILSIPWAFTASFGILAHAYQSHIVYVNKLFQTTHRLYILKILQMNKITDDDFNSVYTYIDKDERLKKLAKQSYWIERVAKIASKMTFLFLILSLLWSVIYPIIFSW